MCSARRFILWCGCDGPIDVGCEVVQGGIAFDCVAPLNKIVVREWGNVKVWERAGGEKCILGGL